MRLRPCVPEAGVPGVTVQGTPPPPWGTRTEGVLPGEHALPVRAPAGYRKRRMGATAASRIRCAADRLFQRPSSIRSVASRSSSK